MILNERLIDLCPFSTHEFYTVNGGKFGHNVGIMALQSLATRA